MSQSAIIETARAVIRNVNTVIRTLSRYSQAVTLSGLIAEQRNLEQTIDEHRSGKRPLEDVMTATSRLYAAQQRSLAELDRLQGTNP